MAQNEKTSAEVAAIASRAMRTGQATPEEIRIMGASLITQVADKQPVDVDAIIAESRDEQPE